jgi:hypothetical protein
MDNSHNQKSRKANGGITIEKNPATTSQILRNKNHQMFDYTFLFGKIKLHSR